ncbi:DUF559 domain-containing protein [bacterium]|nr:DUF559 domain-containing protein [bacterium]
MTSAVEINDLYDGSTLEDKMWVHLKLKKIPAERQEFIKIKNRNYFLDFSIYCASGKLNIETDGDRWHHNPEKAAKDNLRNNDLVSVGWQILRFSQLQIVKQMDKYCMPKIIDEINQLGGVFLAPGKFKPILPSNPDQYFLFDN